MLYFKTVIYLLASLFYCNSLAQELSIMEINAGGGEFQADRLVYSYSIGGFATTTYETENEILTQGFQQVDSIITQVVNIDPRIKISAFPNPAKDKVFIVFSTLEKPVNCIIEFVSPAGTGAMLNQEYYFENEEPVEVKINRNKDGILWLKIYEKGSNNLIGMVKVLLVK